MNLVPLSDKIIIRRDTAEDRTPGGIVLPDSAKKKPARGRVLAVGDGRLLENGQRVPVAVKEGDTVLFLVYSANDIDIKGEELTIIREEDVIAILKK